MKLSELKDGQLWVIRATSIESMMSGAFKAGFHANGEIWLMYNDGSKEVAQVPLEKAQELCDKENWFSIVEAVQSKREYKGL